MELINTTNFIIEALTFSKSFRKKNITNYYFDSSKSSFYIQNNKLYSVKIKEVIFVIKRNEEFSNLYYFASDSKELKESLQALLLKYPNLIFIVDIVSITSEFDVLNIFKDIGFSVYTSLVRMSRISDEYSIKYSEIHSNLKVADLNDSLEVLELLEEHFDPKAEQLPTIEDMHQWCNNKNILIYKIKDKVAGFIIYQLVGLTLYLRYWFVAPQYREMKIGSKLFNYFLSKGKDSKRQLFWVIQSNQNAIVRYEHYGFNKEKMFNFVLINNNLKYEK